MVDVGTVAVFYYHYCLARCFYLHHWCQPYLLLPFSWKKNPPRTVSQIIKEYLSHRSTYHLPRNSLAGLFCFMHIIWSYTTTVYHQYWFIRQTERQTDIWTDRHLDRHLDRQTGCFLYISNKFVCRAYKNRNAATTFFILHVIGLLFPLMFDKEVSQSGKCDNWEGKKISLGPS